MESHSGVLIKLFVSLSLLVLVNCYVFKTEECLDELERGRSLLHSVAGQLVADEHHRQQQILRELHRKVPSKGYMSVRFIAKDDAQCPQPNTTIFTMPTTTTTPTPTPPPTEPETEETTSSASAAAMNTASSDASDGTGATMSSSGGAVSTSSSGGAASTQSSTDSATSTQTAAVPQREAQRPRKSAFSKAPLNVPSMFHTDLHLDPYVHWMSKLHRHLNKDDAVCNGPAFKNIQSVTEDQLWGFISLLLSNHGSSMCSICDRMVGRVEQLLLQPNPILLSEEEEHIHRIIFAHFPKTEGICSMVLPSCHADYALQAANVTNATKCMECSLCMTALNVVQHRFLLDAKMLKEALAWLDSSFIHNICAELCMAFPPGGPTNPDSFFPNGVDYPGCVAFSHEAFTFVIDAARNILKPEYFCSLELGWCEMNATPNIMFCLKELCDEGLPLQLSSTICKLIPAEEELADKYLNLNRTPNQKTAPEPNERPANVKNEL